MRGSQQRLTVFQDDSLDFEPFVPFSSTQSGLCAHRGGRARDAGQHGAHGLPRSADCRRRRLCCLVAAAGGRVSGHRAGQSEKFASGFVLCIVKTVQVSC